MTYCITIETVARVTLFHEESAKGCQPRIKKEKNYEEFIV